MTNNAKRQRYAAFLRYSVLFDSSDEPHQHRRNLCAACLTLRGKRTVAHAVDNAVHRRPAHRLICIIADRVRVRIVQLERPCAGEALPLELQAIIMQ